LQIGQTSDIKYSTKMVQNRKSNDKDLPHRLNTLNGRYGRRRSPPKPSVLIHVDFGVPARTTFLRTPLVANKCSCTFLIRTANGVQDALLFDPQPCDFSLSLVPATVPLAESLRRSLTISLNLLRRQ